MNKIIIDKTYFKNKGEKSGGAIFDLENVIRDLMKKEIHRSMIDFPMEEEYRSPNIQEAVRDFNTRINIRGKDRF